MRKVQTRFEMLSEYWDWDLVHQDRPEGGNKMLDMVNTFPLSPQGPFYHGTAAQLQPGDVIEPRVKHRSNPQPDWSKEELAFAATGYNQAANYAASRGRDAGGTGYIYEVEPLNDDIRPDQIAGQPLLRQQFDPDQHGEAYVSPSGWRVVRLVDTI